MASRNRAIKLSLLVLCLLAVSLPLKISYFSVGYDKALELEARRTQAVEIRDYLVSEGFEILLEPVDGFLPAVAATKSGCTLFIAPVPSYRDLDSTFLLNAGSGAEQITYYFDGDYFPQAPIFWPRVYGLAFRHLPKFGIPIDAKIRLGIAHQTACELNTLDFSFLGRPNLF